MVKNTLIIALCLCVLLPVYGCQYKADQTQETPRQRSTDPSNVNGFSVVEDSNGKFWFHSPNGDQFLSIGINNVIPVPWRPKPDTDFYAPVDTVFGGDFDKWKTDVTSILSGAGFNTFGSWSNSKLMDGPLYGTMCLYVAAFGEDRCLEGLRPGFEDRIRQNIAIALKDDPKLDNVMGFFLDNEMPWYGHSAWGDIPNFTLFESAIDTPMDDGAHQAVMKFIKDRYKTPQQFADSWGRPVASWDDVNSDYVRGCVNDNTQRDRNDFIEFVAEEFFRTSTEIVREMFPGKLILGPRFGGDCPDRVMKACGKYCDVISFNDYRDRPIPDEKLISRYWVHGGRPLMITEYAWRAEENTSGNPNTGGAGSVVKTQAERAANYSAYVEELFSYPMMIGAHWFEFADQSPQGRFDGENSNYGIVDIKHRPYKLLVDAMTKTNNSSAKIHADSTRVAPTSLPKPAEVVFTMSQRPDRPPFIDLLAEESIKSPALFYAPDAKFSLKGNDGAMVLSFDTGTQWGGGVAFFGPKKYAVGAGPEHTTNLEGYSNLTLDIDAPDDISFEVFVDEAATDAPDMASYEIAAGDDGESFKCSAVFGQGKRAVYEFDLKKLLARTEWGNQDGLKRVDMHAMKGVVISLRSGQNSGKMKIYSVKLTR